MAEWANVAAFAAALDAAVDGAMQNEVSDGAKEALQDMAYENVYNYQPVELVSRRGASGGIADIGNMEDSYGGGTLTIEDMATWQQLYGGAVPGERLAEALASGSRSYNFHLAGPRPFHEEAERLYASSGQFESDFWAGLIARGFSRG